MVVPLWQLKGVHELLKQYLEECPEHDQADFKVYWAYELLSKLIKQYSEEV